MLLFFGLAISALAIPAVLVGTQLEGLVKVDQHINAWLLPAFLLSFAAIAILKDSTKNKTFGQALYVHSLNGFYASEAADLIFRGSKDKNKTPRFATLIGYKTNTNGAESK
jgi:hypothetical protein